MHDMFNMLAQVATDDNNPVLAFFAAFGGIGAVSWALDAAVFKWFSDNRRDIPNPDKVLISLATPFALVLAVYFLGIAFGQWILNWDTLWHALVAAAAGLAGAKGIFGVTTKAEATTSGKSGNSTP